MKVLSQESKNVLNKFNRYGINDGLLREAVINDRSTDEITAEINAAINRRCRQLFFLVKYKISLR